MVAEPSIYCKYVAVALKRGGGLMLGFDEERYLVEPDLEPGRIVSVVAIAMIVVILFLTIVAFTRGCIRAAEARAAWSRQTTSRFWRLSSSPRWGIMV